MRIRHFQIPSAAISGNGSRTVTFPRRTRNTGRFAIIGIGYDAADPQDALLNTITGFKVGARDHVHGDGVVLGLIAPGAEPVGTGSQNGWNKVNYFPCSAKVNGVGEGIPISGIGMVGGIPLIGAEVITITLAEVSSGNNPVDRITLHCVQFDDAPDKDAINNGKYDKELERFWERFAKKGIGAIHFHGTNVSHLNTVVLSTTVNQEIRSPYQCKVRRLGYLGLKTTTTAVAEDNFADDSVQIYAGTEKPHSPVAVAARTVIGHAHLWYPGAVEVDLPPGGRSLIDYAGPDPGADMIVRLAGVFQGMSDEESFLCGPDAF